MAAASGLHFPEGPGVGFPLRRVRSRERGGGSGVPAWSPQDGHGAPPPPPPALSPPSPSEPGGPGCSGARSPDGPARPTRRHHGDGDDDDDDEEEEDEDDDDEDEEEEGRRCPLGLQAGGRLDSEEDDDDDDEDDDDDDEEEERMINLSELTPYILCSICKGYFIDATTITECLHTFCKSCIVRHFYYSNRCPKCNIVVHQTQPLYNIRLDRQLQDIVYKLVINLEEREKKQMHDFYKERGLEVPKPAVPQPVPVSRGRPRKVLGSVFRIPPELDMSLLLEFIGANEGTGHFKPLEKKFVRVSGEATIGHVEKFLRRKMGLDPACQVDIICGDHLLEHYQTLREIRCALGDGAMQDGLLVLHYGLVVSPL
ncbi:polycomb group RING finger protein 6 [Tachyglossus aculeatus]|uniref:polycomb group RING finger protein 6 n=1 Tax=Tachyglossus aculeatus TaxID=9261 RepID=UPI0018F4E371|nr:polycomb group RING finger protein 6 [Tachyglossus aculeatus]